MVQHLDPMRHDRHLVERRLSVKNNQVVIAQMAFDHKTRVEGQVIQMLDEAQVDPSSIGMDDVASSRPDSGTISN